MALKGATTVAISTIIEGQRYRIRVSLGRDGGRQRFLSETLYGSLADAKRRETVLKGEKAAGKLSERSRETVGALLADLLRSKRGQVRDLTLEEYSGALQRALKLAPDFFGRALVDVKPGHVRQLYATLGRRRSTQIFATVLRQAFRRAVIDQMIPSDPTAYLRPPGPESKRPARALSSEELGKLVESLDATRPAQLALLIMLTTAMRPSEVLALRVDDLDPATGRLQVARRLRRHCRKDDITAPKSAAGRRTVAVPGWLVSALAQSRTRALEVALASRTPRATAPLLPAPGGAPLQRAVLADTLRRIAERAGISGRVTPYTLRHSAATMLVRSGMDLRSVAAAIGHENPHQTLLFYAHASPTAAEDAAERIGRVLGEHLRKS